MNAKHTPGPWTYRFRVGGTVVETGAGEAIALTVSTAPGGSIDGNARLIAAAPALLAACEAAKHVWEQGCVDRGWKDEPNWIDEAKELIDAAIAQAKGEA